MNNVTVGEPWQLERPLLQFRPTGSLLDPLEVLSRSWSISALEIPKVLAPPKDLRVVGHGGGDSLEGDKIGETLAGNSYPFVDTETTKLIIERIMSQSEVSPRTSERLSHSSGGLNGFLTDSPPVSPSEIDDAKYHSLNNFTNAQFRTTPPGGKTVGRWLKERKEKKKQETRAHNAQLHASISVAGVAAAIASTAASAASLPQKDYQMATTNVAFASAAALVAAQCVDAAEALGADRSHLASIVGSAVNVRSAGDIMTLTAAAATALRGTATLRARALKKNVSSIGLGERLVGYGSNGSNDSPGEELAPDDNFTDICSQKLLARGSELLKRTRNGDLHCKIVSVYINRMGQVMLKMKSRRTGGTITRKKKHAVLGVCKDMPSWPGRHLLDGGEHRRYFGLKTMNRGIVEFECKNQREHDEWVQGVQRLLAIVRERNLRKGF